MIQIINEGSVLPYRRRGDASLATKEGQARPYELFREHEGDGGLLQAHARATQLHPYPDVRLDEAQDSVEVPGEHVDVVDGRGEDENAVQLPDAVGGEIDFNAIEKSMFQARL